MASRTEPNHPCADEGAPAPRSQAFERYPALAGWIERLASTGMSLSLGEWAHFLAALNEALERAEAAPPYRYMWGPWENCDRPSITTEDPLGGDPHILGEFARVYRPDDLAELCRLANIGAAVERQQAEGWATPGGPQNG